ncbi:MAG: creatininase family protein [Pseudomonadota bacterium]
MKSMTRTAASLALALLLSMNGANAQGVYLGDLAWPEARERLVSAPLVILPFAGGAKEHGRHLPMNADRVVLEHLVSVAVSQRDVVAAPPILYGWFPAFREFPSTEIEDPAIFQQYMYLAAKSLVASGAQRVVFLNTGIRQATGLPISVAAREIRAGCGVPALVVSWDDLETSEVERFQEQEWGGHADEIETSVNLVLQPDKVDMSKASPEMGAPPKTYPGYRPGKLPARQLSGEPGSGIRGDPTLATAEKGRQTLAIMERNWLAALDGFANEPTPGSDGPCAVIKN